MQNQILLLFLFYYSLGFSQNNYWQQHVDYKMEIDVNVKDHTYSGEQKLIYTNNSPDVLTKVFYHLYFNAFKPGTDLEQNSRYSIDDSRTMSEKLLSLPKEDWGDVQIKSLKQDSVPVEFSMEETVLEVLLKKPLRPRRSNCLTANIFVTSPAKVAAAWKSS